MFMVKNAILFKNKYFGEAHENDHFYDLNRFLAQKGRFVTLISRVLKEAFWDFPDIPFLLLQKFGKVGYITGARSLL